ncbi:MAG: orotidine-5'-phosphate decarboxylase [Gemmatimonadota bacterium]|nr:MAG: orotidine-5'-phosphate decarboxylase [Gemmatimonadota bacterium]
MSATVNDRIIVALDFPTRKGALEMVEALEGASFFKVGAQLFTEAGPGLIGDLIKKGKKVFLDLKFHDIPNTVAGAVRAAAQRGVEMLTVHASGGEAMLRAAREAAGDDGPTVVAVTLLTSLASEDVEHVFGRTPASLVDEVVRLTGLAVSSGLSGVVASPAEVKPLKRSYGDVLQVVTPGIRLAGDDPADQSRFATPERAARAGADYLVVGRSITAARDPAAAFAEVVQAYESGRGPEA